MDNEYMAANDVDIADPQEQEVQPDVSTDNDTSTSQSDNTSTTQEVTQTQAFAARLKAEKQKAIDEVYANIYGEHGIHSKAEYDAAIERERLEREAGEKGIDPDFYTEFNSVKNELSNFKREKELLQQEKQLNEDPFYKDNKTEIEQILQSNPGTDLIGATLFLKAQKFNDVLKENATLKAATQQNQTNKQQSMGSVTGQGSVANDHISKETFEQNKSNMTWVQANYDSLVKSMKKW